MEESVYNQIREKAYEIWQYRQDNSLYYIIDKLGNLQEITPEDDWLLAEQQVRQFCLGECGRLLTVEQKNNPDVSKLRCDFCRPIGIQHAKEFPQRFKKLEAEEEE